MVADSRSKRTTLRMPVHNKEETPSQTVRNGEDLPLRRSARKANVRFDHDEPPSKEIRFTDNRSVEADELQVRRSTRRREHEVPSSSFSVDCKIKKVGSEDELELSAT